MKNQNLDLIVTLVKQWFSEQYQENLDELILYGSQARGDAHKYSDIDVLVVLKQAFSYREEIDRTSQFITDLSLEYDTVISRAYYAMFYIASAFILGDIFEIARGGSPRPIQNFITNDIDGIPWIMIRDASSDSKYITSTKKQIIKEGITKSRIVNPGDFLLTNSMSFGHPYILKTSGCIHDGWLVLSPKKDGIDRDYFYYLLGSDSVDQEFSRRARGTTVKNLNIDLVSSVNVSFPPLEEQKRIAAILDKADRVRRKRQEAIRLTEELGRSIFLDMFGDPVINPKGWEVVKIDQIVDAIESGWSPFNFQVESK